MTRDSFIVFTSNIFAILGLRSLYFLLARLVERAGAEGPGFRLRIFFLRVSKWAPLAGHRGKGGRDERPPSLSELRRAGRLFTHVGRDPTNPRKTKPCNSCS
jgi:hypothetical protein